jgi:hypothetical protein
MKGVDVGMLIIKFSIYNQRLRRISSGIIPLNAYGKLKFEFDFRTDDWNKVDTKTANFYYRGENYKVDLDEHNQCFVPKEVIYSPSFSVSVFGGDIVTNYITNPVEAIESNPGVNPPSSDVCGVVFVPSISEDKILSWTNNGNLENPDPVDLNPFDEWSETGNEIETDYVWEPMQ